MTQNTGVEFERRVAEAIKQLDYKVTTEPLQRRGRTTWQDRISSWLLKPSHSLPGPDMLVVHGGKVALVEAKAYPVLARVCYSGETLCGLFRGPGYYLCS